MFGSRDACPLAPSDGFIPLYRNCLEGAPDSPYTREDFPPAGLSGKGRAGDGMKCNSPTASASGPLEERMATAVKHETRRETNISLDKPIYTISVASEI